MNPVNLNLTSQRNVVVPPNMLMDVPHFTGAKKPIVEITDVIVAGVVYLAKYIKGSLEYVPPDLEAEGEKKLALKVIYSGMAFERYGQHVHEHLALQDMAPKHFLTFAMKVIGPPSIEEYQLMEYLPPPSNDSAGWISLFDFENKFQQVARRSKDDIKEALYKIIEALEERHFVHGDLRPNNLLISIKFTTTPDGCIIQNRPNSVPPLPYLKVIDFDWAGDAGVVEYPPHRNEEVVWPGQSGMPILATHDKLMIESWLSKWALVKDEGGGMHDVMMDVSFSGKL